MTKALKTKILRYAVSIVIGLAMAYYYVSGRNFAELSQVDQYHVLCDAFTIPGLFMVLIGLLMVMNNLGALDTMAYGFSYVMHMLAPGAFDKMPSFLDFVEARREKREGGFGFLFVVGFLLLAVAVVFLVLYYSVK